MLGRAPSALEFALFEKALGDLLSIEYASTPTELRHED
jgi:hypothetical protein